MYRVLLVDDEILVRDAIRRNIDWQKLGYELAGDCQNGKEAIEFVQEHPVDLYSQISVCRMWTGWNSVIIFTSIVQK